MKRYLTKKYRLIWNGRLIITNDYEEDYSGSLTSLIIPDDPGYDPDKIIDYIESDTYSDITDKINELGLMLPPQEDFETE